MKYQDSADDSRFYATACEDLFTGKIDIALAAKAMALSGGDQKKEKSIYLQLAVDRLKESEKEMSRQRAKAARAADLDSLKIAGKGFLNLLGIIGILLVSIFLTIIAVIAWAKF